MLKHLLSSICMVAILSSCAPSGQGKTDSTNEFVPTVNKETPFHQDILPANLTASSMMEQPGTEDGGFVLYPGFYEADFKSYCLQPGTPDPGRNDAYFLAAADGPRKEIIQSILRNSQSRPDLEQQNIQVLLWAVVSRTAFNKLSYWVQATGKQLLTQKQIYELNGGTMGMIKTVATMIPSGGDNDVKKLFDLGVNSYEAYERLAVIRQPSKVHRPDFKLNQWYKHPDGYFVRYYPDGYQKTKIQVYVPATNDSTSNDSADGTRNYIVFDPASMVIAPANTNAQRLGIGAPVLDVVRSVIKIIEKDKKPRAPEPKSTKGGNKS